MVYINIQKITLNVMVEAEGITSHVFVSFTKSIPVFAAVEKQP